MRIRTTIKHIAQRRCRWFNETWIENLNNSPLCGIIPLTGGMAIYLDQPTADWCKLHREPPGTYPDKNGVIKNLSVDIVYREDYDGDDIEPVTRDELKRYIDEPDDLVIDRICRFKYAPEKLIDQFIKDNGGIDTVAYKKWLDEEYEKPKKRRGAQHEISI